MSTILLIFVPMEETWRPMVGFEGLYEVSNLCRIFSFHRSSRLAEDGIKIPKLSHRGYYIVQLTKNGKQYTRSIHRLMAEAFIPNPDNLPVVDHINDIKTDNRIDNLQWLSHSDNQKKRF